MNISISSDQPGLLNSAVTPTVVIVGRPNVGKSALFNRLLGKRRALVHDRPGVTRDRLIEVAQWWFAGKKLDVTLIDTGGLGEGDFSREIEEQVRMALECASVVLMVMDSQTGLLPADEEVIEKLHRQGVFKALPVLGVINKMDEALHDDRIHEFYSSGIEELFPVSAEHGKGAEELKERVLALLFGQANPQSKAEILDLEEREKERQIELKAQAELVAAEGGVAASAAAPAPHYKRDAIPSIAIVGKPNVGKSTLLNALCREERMITSPIAGTTVDAIDTLIDLDGKTVRLIDTAGIRRKSKTEKGVEVLSVVQTKKALERSDLALLVLDGETGPVDQDEKIASLIDEAGCSVILVLNKWDVHRKNGQGFTQQMAVDRIYEQMGFLRYAPILVISALRGSGLDGLPQLIADVLEQRSKRLTTRELTDWMRKESGVHNPGEARFYLCQQVSSHPPAFVSYVSDPDKIHFSLRRHFINAMRDRWGFMGSPIWFKFVKSQNSRSNELQ